MRASRTALTVLGAVVFTAGLSGACAKGTAVEDQPGIGGSEGDAEPDEDVSAGGAAGANGGAAGTDASAGGGGVAGAAGDSGALDGDAGGAAGTAGAAGTSQGGTAGASGTGGSTGGSAGTGGAAGQGGTGGSAGKGGTGGTGGTAGTGGTGGTAGTGGSAGSGGCEIKAWHFNSCPEGWTSGGTSDDWTCGAPLNGPSDDHTGSGNAFSTGVLLPSFCENASLTSPTVNLSSYAGQALRLQFWHWYAFNACGGAVCTLVCMLEKSTYSGGIVEAWNGTQWTKISPQGGYTGQKIECYSTDPEAGATCSPCELDGVSGFDGSSNGVWMPVEMDISSYAINGFQVRFHFANYDNDFVCHTAKRGWFVDDVAIVKLGPC